MTHTSESFKKGIVQRMFRNFLDIMVLRLVKEQPMWGYKIIRHVEEEYSVKLRHGALYPLLNDLQKKGYVRGHKEAKGGRIRKVYTITSKGIQLVEAYIDFLKEQTQDQGIKAN